MTKKIALTILIAVLGTTLLVALGAVTYAWYSSRVTANNGLEIPASGAIVMDIQTNEVTSGSMYPAIAMPYAIRNNKNIDVLTVYDDTKDESEISYVSQVATTFGWENEIAFYEDPTKDNYTYQCNVGIVAYVEDGDGNKYNVNDEVSYSLTADITYADESLTSENETDKEISLDTPFSLLGKCMIKLKLLAYYTNVDEECDPIIIGKKLYLTLTSTITYEEND